MDNKYYIASQTNPEFAGLSPVQLEARWQQFAESLLEKYQIRDTYFASSRDASSETLRRIEMASGGQNRRQAIEAAFKALSIIGDQNVIPLLESLPVYRFSSGNIEYGEPSISPVFEKAKDTIELIKNSNA